MTIEVRVSKSIGGNRFDKKSFDALKLIIIFVSKASNLDFSGR